MKKEITMQIVNAHAAGIDVGSRSHFVAIGQDVAEVREFGVYTQDHEQLIEWLSDQGRTEIAKALEGNWNPETDHI